jgi:hypothetical protein
MTSAKETRRLKTADDPDVIACTGGVPGVEHDYRLYTYRQYGDNHTSLVCVWCSAVACGNASDFDPCIEPYHHRTWHRSRFGQIWAKGECRPERREPKMR